MLDELGRGTATFDGYAIAYATLLQLLGTNVRVLFSTHYRKYFVT
jgi:DNA mismatch repair protein MSH6